MIRADRDQEGASFFGELGNAPPGATTDYERLTLDALRAAALLLLLEARFERSLVPSGVRFGGLGRFLELCRLGPPGICIIEHVHQVEPYTESLRRCDGQIDGTRPLGRQIRSTKNTRSCHARSIDQGVGGAQCRR